MRKGRIELGNHYSLRSLSNVASRLHHPNTESRAISTLYIASTFFYFQLPRSPIFRSYARLAISQMTSNPGASPISTDQSLSPTQGDSSNLDDVSDVESFSRTRPDVEDDEEELDSPEPEEEDEGDTTQIIRVTSDNDATPTLREHSPPPEQELSIHVIV
jgi:hypothetical protein